MASNPLAYSVEGATSMPGNPLGYTIQQTPQQQQQQQQHFQQQQPPVIVAPQQQQMLMTQQQAVVPPMAQPEFTLLSPVQHCSGSPGGPQQAPSIATLSQPSQAEYQLTPAPSAQAPAASASQDGEPEKCCAAVCCLFLDMLYGVVQH